METKIKESYMAPKAYLETVVYYPLSIVKKTIVPPEFRDWQVLYLAVILYWVHNVLLPFFIFNNIFSSAFIFSDDLNLVYTT